MKGSMGERKIPNFNTLSTLIDRLSIENVKLAHFENAIEQGHLTEPEVAEFQRKISVQHDIIGALKEEVAGFLKEAFLSGTYEYIKEERTFK